MVVQVGQRSFQYKAPSDWNNLFFLALLPLSVVLGHLYFLILKQPVYVLNLGIIFFI